MGADELPAAVNIILCSWESLGVILAGLEGPQRRKTFIHKSGDRYAVTRFTGAKLTGHIVLSRRELAALEGMD